MARFFFNLYDDAATLDKEGMRVASRNRAIAHARMLARVMASDGIRRGGKLVLHHRVVVLDELRAEIGCVTFGDVVKISRAS